MRFGGKPKGLQLVGGLRIIDRVADALRAATRDLVLSANDPDAANWLPSVAIVSDKSPGFGGIAGVAAALRATGSDALVVAWDMPFVSGELLRLISRSAADRDCVVPESESPYGVEPFCAFYSQRLLGPMTEFIEAGGGPARDFLKRVPRLRRLRLDELAAIGDVRRLFFGVNSPADLERARAMAADRG